MPVAAAHGVTLQLTEHTHGGMIVGLDRLVARGNGGFVSGAYTIGSVTLYVGSGTALWPGFALRLGRPSELTLFTLRCGVGQGRAVRPMATMVASGWSASSVHAYSPRRTFHLL